jgi:hypothetical protein
MNLFSYCIKTKKASSEIKYLLSVFFADSSSTKEANKSEG